MRRLLAPLAALVVWVASAAPAFCVIYEVADKDGNVTHYKYTDAKGSLVFTDNLAAIPESIRKAHQVVRVGPPPKPKPPPGDQAGAPGAPSSLQDALRPAAPAAPAPRQESGGFPWWLAAAGAAVLAGAAVAFKFLGSRREVPPPRSASPAYRGRARTPGGQEAPPRRPERSGEAEDSPSARRPVAAAAATLHAADSQAEPRPREESPREAVERLIQAGDLAGAAQLCDAQGDLARGGELYLKAGLHAEAAANFEQLGDFARAGESHLKAGEPGLAAACFERSGDQARGFAALAGYWYDQGDTRQAADWAEKAGDLIQAATYRQEVGELAPAADLFFRGGFHSEAAEIFVLLNDLPRAAEAFARAGRALEAAQALEKSGGDARRTAELYEQGGGFYPAGRLFAKLGDLERALGALQQIDASAEDYPQASMLVGMIFLKRGQVGLAQEKFAKVIADRPIQRATLEPYYFLALCHERAGEAEKARAIFEKILAEDYNFRDVKARLAGRS